MESLHHHQQGLHDLKQATGQHTYEEEEKKEEEEEEEKDNAA